MRNIEFRDLKAQYLRYKLQIDSAIQEVIQNSSFINGKEVKELEEQLADYVGIKHCITCANGTDAMNLLMMAWNIKEGDAVFVPDFTFFATGEIVAYRGATPVFVDVDKDTFTMDPEKLISTIDSIIKEGKLTPKAIIPVDLFGLPAEYPRIMKIANKYNLLVLEDGAQGFGGSINGQKACSFGDASTTSFFPAKPLGCYGDGGAIFTSNDALAERLSSLKVHGKGENKYDNIRIGVNSRLDTIQAAVLKVKLKAFITHELKDVNKAYEIYSQNLKDIVIVPHIPVGYYSSFAQYTIRLSDKQQRNVVSAVLNQNRIPNMIYYTKPMHKQVAFKDYNYEDNNFINTNELCDTVLSLPMHPYLKEEDIFFIYEIIRSKLCS